MVRRIFTLGITNLFIVLLFSAVVHRYILTYFYVTLLAIPFACFVALLQIKYFLKIIDQFDRSIRDVVIGLYILSSTLLSFSFNSTVPLNIDRSFSVWMINQIATDSEPRDVAEIEKKSSEFFSPKNGEIQRRISEQISLGNLEIVEEKVRLTPSGERVWKINRIIANLFNLNKNYAG